MKKTIQELEAERLEWSTETFRQATPLSSLLKLHEEVKEVIEALGNLDVDAITEEYADCLMCLFDSAGRLGISLDEIFDAFAKKLVKNKARVWSKNPDNTYSHVK